MGELLFEDVNLDVQSIYTSFTSIITDSLIFASFNRTKDNISRTLSSPRPLYFNDSFSSPIGRSPKKELLTTAHGGMKNAII